MRSTDSITLMAVSRRILVFKKGAS